MSVTGDARRWAVGGPCTALIVDAGVGDGGDGGWELTDGQGPGGHGRACGEGCGALQIRFTRRALIRSSSSSRTEYINARFRPVHSSSRTLRAPQTVHTSIQALSLRSMAQAAWLPQLPSSPDHFGMNPDNSSPQRQDLTRWELAEILKSSTLNGPRDRSMSIDTHSHYDHPMDMPPPSSHPNSSHLSMHPFDQEKMDMGDHSYDLFSSASNPQSNSYLTGRMRSNTSPAAPSYSMPTDSLYNHHNHNYSDSVPSFQHSPQNSSPYDIMTNMSSSYSSGKVTPLTPNDPLGGMPHSFASGGGMKQDYSTQHYPDLLSDRRVGSNGYPHDVRDDMSIGVNTNLGYSSGPMFPDRISRYQPDSLFSQSPSSHMSHSHGSDLLRGVAPQATHYDDMPGFLAPNPHSDMGLRVPGVHDGLMPLRMQGQDGMGTATNLQSFVRSVSSSEIYAYSLN